MGLTWDTQLKIAKGVLITNTIIGIISIFFARPLLPFILGLIFGTLISILNFRLLALSVEKSVELEPAQAQVYAASRYMIRYFIVGLVIYISLRAEYINALGTIIGLLTQKFVILKCEAFNDKSFFKKIFRRKEVK